MIENPRFSDLDQQEEINPDDLYAILDAQGDNRSDFHKTEIEHLHRLIDQQEG